MRDHGGAQAHHERAHLLQLDLEAFPVRALEPQQEVVALEVGARDRDRQHVRLPGELHVGLVQHADRLDLHALGGEHALAFRHLRGQDRARLVDVHAADVLVDRPHEVVADVSHEAAERGGDPGPRRHQHLGDHQLPRERDGVERSGAAEREQDEVARIIAALQRHETDRARHFVVGHADDGGGDLVGAEAEVRADLLVEDVPHTIELRRARDAEQPVRVQTAEQEIGVGRGRLVATAAVADRPRLGAGALRSHLQDAGGVHARDGAAAGADRVDIDHRHADGQPVAHLLVGGHGRHAVADHADIEAGAAHVARDDVAIARGERGVGGGLDPGRRPRHERVDGVASGDVDRHGPAIALHDQQLAPAALAPQLTRERSQVPVDHRLHVAVDRRRGAALELTVLG